MGSESQLVSQPVFHPSTLRSVYSVGDVEGVLGPPVQKLSGYYSSRNPSIPATATTSPPGTGVGYLQGFSNVSAQGYQPYTQASTSRTATLGTRQQVNTPRQVSTAGPRSLPSRQQAKRKVGVINVNGIADIDPSGSRNISNVAEPQSLKSEYPDQTYTSLVPKSLQRNTYETATATSTTFGNTDHNASDPPPSYSPPRKTLENSVLARQASRKNSSLRKPRSRRESRQQLADTESDQATSAKEEHSTQRKVSSPTCYPCGCVVEMNQWSVQNVNSSNPQHWSQHNQQATINHTGLPRNYIPPTQGQVHLLSHPKCLCAKNDRSKEISRRPLGLECRNAADIIEGQCYAHHCHPHPQGEYSSGCHTCCTHQHLNVEHNSTKNMNNQGNHEKKPDSQLSPTEEEDKHSEGKRFNHLRNTSLLIRVD